MTVSSLALLVVLGSFFSPKGIADSTIFYPTSCLGGWVNPKNAEGEPQATSNEDESQFHGDNSAILPKNTNADIYCGNFTGKFEEATKPTKIVVSLSLTKGQEILLESMIQAEALASSSQELLNIASTTEMSNPLISTSTENASSSSVVQPVVPEAPLVAEENIATSSIPVPVAEEAAKITESIIQSITETLFNLFDNKPSTETDTVVVPTAPEPTVTPTDEPPTSFIHKLQQSFVHSFAVRAFAQESTPSETSESVTIEEASPEIATTTENVDTGSTTLLLNTESASTTEDLLDNSTTTSASTTASSTIENILSEATSSTPVALEPLENQFQNNFLEVFYTFDGHNWESLGELNEISMKYRTFEIPLQATSTWKDMSNIQIKIASKKHMDDTPTVYLDGIRLEVLYETVIVHAHPDFKRDTILKDVTVDGIRLVTLINSDNNKEEVWYMHLDTDVAESVATSTALLATTTLLVEATTTATGTELIQTTTSTTTSATSAAVGIATSTEKTKYVVPKNKWLKWEGLLLKDMASERIIEEIRKQEKLLTEDNKLEEPDFSLDIIKRIKGTILQVIVVQVERDNNDELWLYNVVDGNLEKVAATSSISVSPTYPLGVKGDSLFWVSADQRILYAYNLDSKKLQQLEVPPFDESKGERAEINIDGVQWKVIIGSEDFSFYSPVTGEVFSDDDGTVAEEFRRRLDLDRVLDGEELSNLNLSPKVKVSGEEQ